MLPRPWLGRCSGETVGLPRREERPSPLPRCFSRLEAAELEAEAEGEEPEEAVELEERKRPLAPPPEGGDSVWPPLDD